MAGLAGLSIFDWFKSGAPSLYSVDRAGVVVPSQKLSTHGPQDMLTLDPIEVTTYRKPDADNLPAWDRFYYSFVVPYLPDDMRQARVDQAVQEARASGARFNIGGGGPGTLLAVAAIAGGAYLYFKGRK
jgi:hypothetical protein